MPLYCGIDLHSNNVMISVIDDDDVVRPMGLLKNGFDGTRQQTSSIEGGDDHRDAEINVHRQSRWYEEGP